MLGLDGVRAWAVIAVVAFHAGLVKAGWVGVDVFMALSGFLITGVLIKELEKGQSLSLRNFWRRRARRLLPGLFVLLALVAVVSQLSLKNWTTPTPREVVGALSYSSNWLRLGEQQSYWNIFNAPSALDHLWSLAIEEQFYLLWPLVVLMSWKIGRRRGVILATGLLFIVTAILQILMAFNNVGIERIYVGTDTRAPAFLAGAFACLIRPALSERSVVWLRRTLVLPVGVLIVACFVLIGDERVTYQGPLIFVSLCGAWLALSASHVSATSKKFSMLTAKPFTTIGRWSYGIYLFHWPVLIVIGLSDFNSWVRFLIAMVGSTVLAAMSYELFENRIRISGVSRRMIPLATLVVCAVATMAFLVSETPPPDVNPETQAELTATLPTVVDVAPDATPGELMQSEAAVKSRILVVGDSVVYGLFHQFKAEAARRGFDVAVRAAPGCTMSDQPNDQNNSFTTDLCAQIRRGLRNDVESFRPEEIIVFYGGTWSPYLWHGEEFDPCSTEGQSVMADALTALLVDLKVAESHITLVMPPQMGGKYAQDAPGAAVCYGSFYRTQVDRDPRLGLVRVDKLVCSQDADTCDEVDDPPTNSIQWRTDGLHYTEEGGQAVIDFLLKVLVKSSLSPWPIGL
jgi:peptidoglycan/LPS O-acetylase OafA/YrhL